MKFEFEISNKTLKRVLYVVLMVAVIVAAAIFIKKCAPMHLFGGKNEAEEVVEEQPNLLYGIEFEKYTMVEDKVRARQTLSDIFDGYGVGAAMIDKIATQAAPIFDVRQIREGNNYILFIKEDSVSGNKLEHFVYEKNLIDYVVVSLEGDSVIVRTDSKEVTVNRRKVTAKIESSLWNCMVANDLPVALSCDMEDIFGWSVDFFALQEGDEFTVIYDENFIDTVRVGIGQVWGTVFHHNDKDYYAVPFNREGKISYWDEQGNSLRKQLLKAPLKFTRISSKFSNSRLHPVLKIRRPHHGVDYAAPAGTPVVAISDGTVITKGWDKGGGGNMLKIKHANNLSSAYLHLKGYAKGISVGSHVSQGQLIGYVGSTGVATGPHLDFRLYKGGTAIDPLKAPSESVEPLAKELLPQFNEIKDKVVAELKGEVPDSMKLSRRDLFPDELSGDSTRTQTVAIK